MGGHQVPPERDLRPGYPQPGHRRAHHLQNVFTAMALNSTRLGDYDTDHDEQADTSQKKQPGRPPTRIHQLCRDHGLAHTTTAA